jgi:hypothetical protein
MQYSSVHITGCNYPSPHLAVWLGRQQGSGPVVRPPGCSHHALHCTALHCTTHSFAKCYSIFRYNLFCYKVQLLCQPSTSVHYTALHCTALHLVRDLPPYVGGVRVAGDDPLDVAPWSRHTRATRAMAPAVQCSAVQCSAVQCSAVKCSAVPPGLL